MSNVNVLLIKDGVVIFFSTHYKNVLLLLDKPAQADRLFQLAQRQHYVDAGWIVLDFDKEIAISSQSAFPASRFSNWNVFEI
ncbi:MAG: hypothetical protein QXU88_01085 [Candidatus Woesearchaeota archaeon]